MEGEWEGGVGELVPEGGRGRELPSPSALLPPPSFMVRRTAGRERGRDASGRVSEIAIPPLDIARRIEDGRRRREDGGEEGRGLPPPTVVACSATTAIAINK